MRRRERWRQSASELTLLEGRAGSAAISFGTLSGSILLAHAHGLHLIHPCRRPKSSRSLVAVVALLVLKHGAFNGLNINIL
eukprot:Em0014g383a